MTEIERLRREVSNFLNVLAEQDMDIELLQRAFEDYQTAHDNEIQTLHEKQKVLEDKLECFQKTLDSLKRLVTDKYGKKDDEEKKVDKKKDGPKIPWNPKPFPPFPSYPPYIPLVPRPKRWPPPYIPEPQEPWPLPFNGEEYIWTTDKFEVGYCNVCGKNLMQQGAGDTVCGIPKCPFTVSVTCGDR